MLFSVLSMAHHPAGLLPADQAPGYGRSRGPASSPQRRRAIFFPADHSGRLPRETTRSLSAILRCAAGLAAACRPSRGLVIAIKAAMVAGLRQQMEIIMAQIGSFTRGEDGVFIGIIRTLSLNVKASLIPADASSNEKAPHLRVLVGNVEIGAAWRRTSKENTEYHSVKLDDPSFPAPIYANLVKGETDYALVWSR
jgi:uncharacterized protein (DUF736 family)